MNPLAGYGSVTTMSGLTVGPAQGARFYTPASPNPIAPKVVLVGPNLTPVTLQAGAGQTLYLPVDVSRQGGPFDLYVAGTEGSGTATLQIGHLAVPTILDLSKLRPVQLGLDGRLAASPDLAQNAGVFGSLTGVQYYQLTTRAGNTTLAVQGSGGAQPLLAHYQEDLNLLPGRPGGPDESPGERLLRQWHADRGERPQPLE